MAEDIELTDLEKDLIELIGARRGEARAIPRAELCALLDYVGDRHIRDTIRHLRVVHKIAIASCAKGYYTPVTEEEFKRAGAYYESYGKAAFQNRSALCGGQMLEAAGQESMPFTAPPNGAVGREGAEPTEEK